MTGIVHLLLRSANEEDGEQLTPASLQEIWRAWRNGKYRCERCDDDALVLAVSQDPSYRLACSACRWRTDWFAIGEDGNLHITGGALPDYRYVRRRA